MNIKYIAIVTLLLAFFVQDGSSQDSGNVTDSFVDITTSGEWQSGDGSDNPGDEENSTAITLTNDESTVFIEQTTPTTGTKTTQAPMTSPTIIRAKQPKAPAIPTHPTDKSAGKTTPGKVSTKTPHTNKDDTAAATGAKGTTQSTSDCFSITKPTVYILLVIALVSICMLFIYTIVCSCVLARRRVNGNNYDVEAPQSPQSTSSEKASKEAKKKAEADRKKEEKRLKEAEKKEKERQKAEEKKKKQAEREEKKKQSKKQKKEEEKQTTEVEQEEKTVSIEPQSVSQEKSIEMKEVEEKTTTSTDAETKAETLETIQEVNVAAEGTITESKSEDTSDTKDTADPNENRISSLPPPPPAEDTDNNQPTVKEAEVVVETLPPPPALDETEEAKHHDNADDPDIETDNALGASPSPPEHEVKSETATAPLAKEEELTTDREKAAENLAEAGMKLDEVLMMLDSIKQ